MGDVSGSQPLVSPLSAEEAPTASPPEPAPAAWWSSPGLRLGFMPAAAFAMGNAILWLQAGGRFFDPRLWVRWDANLYLRVADRLHYTMFLCPSPPQPKGAWCGTAGWLPLYPAGINALGKLGLSAPAAGVLLSAVFSLGMFVLIAWWLRASPLPTAAACLALAAVFPGQLYFHAVFPTAALAFFTLLCLASLARGRLVAGGLAGAAAAATYATGFLLAPVAFGWLALQPGDLRRRQTRATGVAALISAGFGVVMLIQQIQVGSWLGFFKVQAKYGHGLHNPLSTFWTGARPAFAEPAGSAAWWTGLQSLATAAVVLTVVAFTVARGNVARADRLLIGFTLAFALFPLVMGSAVSPYRSEAALVGSVVLARHLPAPVTAALALACAVIAFGIAPHFFDGAVV